MIQELYMRNFKSWEEIPKMELRSLTALFGANSSGKTALLQFLLLLKQTVESPDRQQVLNFGDGRSPISLGTFRDVVFRHEIPGRLELGVLWDLPKSLKLPMSDAANRGGREIDRLTFHVAITGNDKGRPVVDALRYQVGAVQSFAMTREPKARKKYELQSQYEGFKFRRPRGRPWPLPSPVKCYGFPPEVRTYYQNAEFLYDFELAFEELFGRVYYLGPLREHPRREYTWAGAQPAHMGIRGENVVDALLAARQRGQKISRGRRKTPFTVEEYVAWWLRELDLIHEFSVKRISQDSNLYTVWVKKAADATEVPLTDVGFGVSQILPVIALCYYVPKGSIVILEQPEIHLHPSVQAGLADVFIDAIKTRGIQIIVESHSEHLLRRIQRRIAEERIATDQTALYFCEIENGRSKLVGLELDLFGNIRNWPREFFGDTFGEMAAMTNATMKRKREAAL